MAQATVDPNTYLPAISAALGVEHATTYRINDQWFVPGADQAALDAALRAHDNAAATGKAQAENALDRVTVRDTAALLDDLLAALAEKDVLADADLSPRARGALQQRRLNRARADR
jgi:hypothetical protein